MTEHVRPIWQFLGFHLHADTLVATWITMVLVVIFGWLAGKAVSNRVPQGAQNIMEMVMEFIRGLISENMDYKKGASLLGYLTTLIIFIFFANMLGLLPNFTLKAGHIFNNANMMSPTADPSTTLALSTLTFLIFNIWSIKHLKGKYIPHTFAHPHWSLFLLALIEWIAKPITLAFRLYGNIYAGEVLIGVLLTFFPIGLGYFLGGFIGQVTWLGFSVFVGAIQSFVFTILTIVYIAQAIDVGEEH